MKDLLKVKLLQGYYQAVVKFQSKALQFALVLNLKVEAAMVCNYTVTPFEQKQQAYRADGVFSVHWTTLRAKLMFLLIIDKHFINSDLRTVSPSYQKVQPLMRLGVLQSHTSGRDKYI